MLIRKHFLNHPKESEKNKTTQILYYSDGSWNTAEGSTVKPDNDTVWWHGLVKASLPIDTEQVKVQIEGYHYDSSVFKSWLDQASLGVYYDKTGNEPTYGKISLVTNIFHYEAMQIPEFDGFVSLSVSVAAKAKTGFSIYKIRDLKVELLSNSGSATTQQGRLMILYLQQKNSKSFELDPITTQELINSAAASGQLIWDVLWITADVVVTFIATPLNIPLEASLLWAIGGGAFSSIPIVGEKVHDPVAEGGASFDVSETLNYYGQMHSQTDRVEYYGADYYLDWRFRTDSDDVFAIRVSSVVEWCDWYDPDPMYQGDEYWRYVGATEAQPITISIANYWQ